MKKEKNKKNKENLSEKNFSLRGRTFEGFVIKKFTNRVVVSFDRLLYIPKYERYEKRKTTLHAKLPLELKDSINVGDLVQIKECRPISKTIHFVLNKKIRGYK